MTYNTGSRRVRVKQQQRYADTRVKSLSLEDIVIEEIQNVLDERCQKGYKTHRTRETKKMYGK